MRREHCQPFLKSYSASIDRLLKHAERFPVFGHIAGELYAITAQTLALGSRGMLITVSTWQKYDLTTNDAFVFHLRTSVLFDK